MKKIPFFIVVSLMLTSLACDQKGTYNFAGKWQSLNDPNFVIEFTSDDRFIIYRDGEDFFSKSKLPPLAYAIQHSHQGWHTFSTMDESGERGIYFGRLEVVNDDRIRIYLHKHHGILDLADEYHRTYNLTSYDSILRAINVHQDTLH